jgi:hypothetical protein
LQTAARPSAPALVLALFDIGERPDFAGLAAFVRAIEHANVPDGTVIYAGTYGPNQVTADAINGLQSGVYAPMFSITPKGSRGPYAGRKLPPDDLAKLDPRYDGPIPLRNPDKPLPRGDYLNWGRELGFRFRDTLRHRGSGGAPVATTWQFDEVVSETVLGGLTVQYRLYVAGILQGLHLGRTRLGDRLQTGMVWAAEKTLPTLPQLPTPTGSPMAVLWTAIDKAARLYVGEEYVEFSGDPHAAAERSSLGQRRMLSAGPTRRRIGHKYVVGMTPGFLLPSSGLGGNVHGWPVSRVNDWRERFVRARASLVAVTGFGQFNFTGPNARPDIMRAAIEAAANPFPT